MSQLSITRRYSILLALAVFMIAAPARAEVSSSCQSTAAPSKLFVDEYMRQTATDPDPRPRILVSRFDQSSVPQLKASDISQRLAGQMTSYLVDAGAVVVSDAVSAQSAMPAEYDFKVRGTIQSADVTRHYREEHTWKDRDGKRHTEPAELVYTADVNIKLDVLNGSAADKVIFGEALRAKKSKSVEAKDHQAVDYDTMLVEEALKEALQSKLALLQSRLAHQPIISDVGARDGKQVYEITAGAASGIKPNQRLKVYRVSETTSAFSGMTERREEYLADAVTTGHINETKSWIAFTDKDAQSRVCPQTLYIVKRQFEKTIVENAIGSVRNIFSRFGERVSNVVEQAASNAEPP